MPDEEDKLEFMYLYSHVLWSENLRSSFVVDLSTMLPYVHGITYLVDGIPIDLGELYMFDGETCIKPCKG